MLFAFTSFFTVGLVQAASVTSTLQADKTVLVNHDSITFTCTYTSSINPVGTGYIQVSGPASTTNPINFLSWTTLYLWDGESSSVEGPLLSSGVPVTFTKQLDTPGYYKFHWQCTYYGDSTFHDGAYQEVLIQVLSTPTVLPEAPPLAVFALGFAAVGLFVAVTKRRTKQSEVTLPHF